MGSQVYNTVVVAVNNSSGQRVPGLNVVGGSGNIGQQYPLKSSANRDKTQPIDQQWEIDVPGLARNSYTLELVA